MRREPTSTIDPADTSPHLTPSPTAARTAVLIAALLWSSGGFFAKADIFSDWPAASRGVTLAFWRAVFAGAVLLPVARRRSWDWRMVPMALAFTGMNVSYMSSVALTTAANAIWLQSTAPLWVLVIGMFLGLDRPSPRDLVMLATALAGIGLILVNEVFGEALIGVMCGLGAGVFYALVVVFMRLLRSHDGAWLVALNHLVAALVLGPYVLARQPTPSAAQLGWVATFGVLQMAVPYVLFARGLRTISSQEATAIALVEPVLLPIWVWLAWGERPAWWTLTGGAIIFVGLCVRYWPRTNHA
ncbi:MAG: EamA family transporter [Pirellulales bacterium]|nr:EamA family transporter [Pirellulales bacterium]